MLMGKAKNIIRSRARYNVSAARSMRIGRAPAARARQMEGKGARGEKESAGQRRERERKRKSGERTDLYLKLD